jgi:hypothetical protein
MARKPQTNETNGDETITEELTTTTETVEEPGQDPTLPTIEDEPEETGDENGDDEPEENGTRKPRSPEQRREEFFQRHKYYLEDETKEQAFSRVASNRMTQALDEIRKVGSLSDKNNYTYTDEQVERMMGALQEACQEVADRFAGIVKGKTAFRV